MRRHRTLVLTTAVLAVGLLAAGCRAESAAQHPGQPLYDEYCAVCHGKDGRSVAGMASTPHLSSQGLLTTVDDAHLYENIARGRPGENGRGKPGTKMSVYLQDLGGPLAREEIDLIVSYIRSWQSEASLTLAPFEASGDPEAGQVTYDEVCAVCHGEGGWGTAAPSLAGSTFQDTYRDDLIRHTILNGRTGTTMPGFKLDDREVDDLVTYIRSLYTPPDES